MRSWLICALLALAGVPLASGQVSAQQPGVPRDLATAGAGPALGDAMPDRALAFPGGITALADVPFSTPVGYRPVTLDLYHKPGAGPKPLIIYVHGGGWVAGNTRAAGALQDFPAALAKLAGEGFVVASLEYRLAAEAPHPAQLQDVRAAIRFLKANAIRYGIDSQRIALWGGSAGGHLAALAATSCQDTSFDPAPRAGQPALPAGDTCVQAAAIWYGVFDFAPILARQTQPGAPAAENQLLRCTPATCPPDRVANVSPATFFSQQSPPFLLIHGNDDRTVPVEQSHLAEAKLKALGVPVTAIYIPAVDHSFIGRESATTHAATMTAVNATFNFFHAQFGGRK